MVFVVCSKVLCCLALFLVEAYMTVVCIHSHVGSGVSRNVWKVDVCIEKCGACHCSLG